MTHFTLCRNLFTARNRAAIFALTVLATGCGSGSDGSSDGTGINDSNGQTALVFVSAEAPGLNCLGGGSKVSAGLDVDGDRALGAAEVGSVQYICNGRDGAPGVAGRAIALAIARSLCMAD